MTTEAILTLLAGIFGGGAFLDKVTTPEFRTRTGDLLLSTNRKTFATFVAGTALRVYSAVFANRVNSWRFLRRSVLLTLVFVALGLFFLRLYFPQTYFAATASIRNLTYFPANTWIVAPPIVLMILFDFLCNAQTKFFLSLMASSPSITKFLVLGYADLVATACLAIIGLSISYTAFLFSAYQLPTTDLTISLEFPKFKQQPATANPNPDEKSGLVIAKITPADLDRSLNGIDDYLLNTHRPPTGQPTLEVIYPNGVRTVRKLNERGIAEHFKSENKLTIKSGTFEPIQIIDRSDRCHAFATSATEQHFRFTIIKGWDTQKIEQSCTTHKPIDLNLAIAINDDDFRYSYAATNFAGELIALTLRSLTNRFNEYSMDGFIRPHYVYDNWRWNYWVGDDKPYILFSSQVLGTAWAYRNGGFRALQGDTFLWSTFYIASIFTSLFIWIVLIFTGILYPIAWFLERTAFLPTFIKPQVHPFSLLAIPVALTVWIAVILVT